MKHHRSTTAALLLAALALALAGCGGFAAAPQGARFVREVEWAGEGVWLKADTHTHTQFSDGTHTVADVADRAARYGCDVLAITDHADRNLGAGTHEYIEAIKEARRQHPDMILLAGLEWNIPPHDGNEHVVVLVPPGPTEGQTLAEFKARFDDLGREEHDATLADEALEWLARVTAAGDVRPVAIYEHPSRKRQSTKQIVGDVRRWRAVNDILVGLSGAPGHQRMEPTGAYASRLKTVRRWDPTVANIGDGWDTLLERGTDVWAAYAPSDFHDDSPGALADYWPGEFSETWLYAPDRTAEGALRALRAGSFFGSHGHIVREVELLVETEGLSRPATAGECIEVPPGSQATVRLEFKIPEADWAGQSNRIDEVALIGVTGEGAKILMEGRPSPQGPALTETLDVPASGIVVRARGGRDGMMFCTNPVRIVVRPAGTPLAVGGVSSRPFAAATTAIWDSARSARPLIAMFYALATAGMLVAVYCVPAAQSAAISHPKATTTNAAPRRLHYLLLALAGAVFVIYGSWVPFDFQPLSFSEAWQRFLDAPGLTSGNRGRVDFSTNVLLMVPVSFCGLAALTCDGERRWDRLFLWSPLTLLLCTVLSFIVEFGQVYCLPRVSSHTDIAAQMIGALIGIALWNIAGQSCTCWLRRFRESRPLRGRWEALLQAYLLGLGFCSLLPLDLITGPSELARKYRHGMIVLTPFADFRPDASGWWGLITDVLIYIPLGMLATIAFTGERKPLRSLPASVILGVVLATGIETCQLFVYSRFASTTQLLAATLGVTVGVLLYRWYERSIRDAAVVDRRANPWSRWRWAAASLIYVGFLFAYFWSPYDWMPDGGVMSARKETFFDIPIKNLFWSENFTAMTEVMRKGLLFGLLGALVENTAAAWTTTASGRRWLRLGLFGLACLASLAIEVGQLWLAGATPSLSDTFLYGIGILVGIVVVAKFTFSSPAPVDSDRGPAVSSSMPCRSRPPLAWRWRTAMLLLGGSLATGGMLWAGTSLMETNRSRHRDSFARTTAAILQADSSLFATTIPQHPTAAPRLERIRLPHVPGEVAIWGATGRDDRGQVWLGISCWPGSDASAHLLQFAPETGQVTDRGDVLAELKRAKIYRPGESQQKIHSKIVQAEDGYLYFASMDEGGEKEDGSRLPDWGSHLWRLRPSDYRWEHLLAVPEGLIAVATSGRFVYALGYFDHVVYQYNVDTEEAKSVRIGAQGGHISRNFFCDNRGHVYVPSLRQAGRPGSPIAAALVELDDELREVSRSPLAHYLPDGDLLSHGVTGVQPLDDGSIVFVTHVGYLYRVVPQIVPTAAPAAVESLGWFHPRGQRYVASLFTYPGSRYVMGVVQGQPHEWLVYDLDRRLSSVSPLPETAGVVGLGLYGSATIDNAGAFYLVGTTGEPIAFRAEPPQ